MEQEEKSENVQIECTPTARQKDDVLKTRKIFFEVKNLLLLSAQHHIAIYCYCTTKRKLHINFQTRLK